MSWLLIAAAAAGMLVQDILATVMVVAESRGRAHLAASMDTLGWYAQICCTTVSVTTLSGHALAPKVACVVAVSVANYAGTWSGTRLGHRLTRERPVSSQ